MKGRADGSRGWIHKRAHYILQQNPDLAEHGVASELAHVFATHQAHRLSKEAAGPPPAIPTPQFPMGVQKIQPAKVPRAAGQPNRGGLSTAQPYTQVHSQPPAVNTTPHSGMKSLSPPPAT